MISLQSSMHNQTNQIRRHIRPYILIEFNKSDHRTLRNEFYYTINNELFHHYISCLLVILCFVKGNT